jgi:hypothetical protein
MFEEIYECDDLEETEIDDYLQWQLLAVQKEELLQEIFGMKFNRLIYKDLRSFLRLTGSIAEQNRET